MSEEKTPEELKKEETAAKSAETKAKNKEAKKAKEKRAVSYYFKRTKRARMIVSDLITLEAQDHVMTIMPSDDLYDAKIAFMSTHPGNSTNRGSMFFKMKSEQQKGDADCLLDELLDLPKNALIKMLKDRTEQMMSMSRGQLMVLVLKEHGVVE